MRHSITAVTVGLFGGNVYGFELEQTGDGLPLAWAEGRLTYVVETTGAPHAPNAGDLADGVRMAFSTWNDVSVQISFSEEEPTGTNDPDLLLNNGRNEVFWPARWDADRNVLAHTSIRYSSDGTIVEADILLNPEVNWTSMDDHPGNANGHHDVQNTVTHEIGHFLGLAHSDIDDATMFASSPPGEVRKRSLAPDDVEGIRTLYPQLTTGTHTADTGSDVDAAARGCAALPSTPEGSPSAFLIFLFGLLLHRRMRT